MTTTFAKQPNAFHIGALDYAAMIAELQLAKAQEMAIVKKVNSPEIVAALLTAIASNYASATRSAMEAEKMATGRR
jgi:hypothetical protein